MALVVAEVVFAPVAVARLARRLGRLAVLVGSGLFEIAYFALLATAYRRRRSRSSIRSRAGARRCSCWQSGVVALGHSTSWRPGGGGLRSSVAGILLVRGLRSADPAGCRCSGSRSRRASPAYTLIDKRGITHAGPIPYLELSMLGPALVYAGSCAARKGARGACVPRWAGVDSSRASRRSSPTRSCSRALQRASAASVAAVRETSVVVAAALATVVLKERVTASRFAGACLVVAGVALLALG